MKALVSTLLGVIVLTSIDGRPFPVESTAITLFNVYGEDCGKSGGTIIRVGPDKVCVRESWEQIRDKKIECETQQLCE